MVKSASMLSRVGVVGGVAVRRSGLRTVTTCVAVRGGGGGNPNAVAPPFYRLPDSKEPVRRVCVLIVVGCIPCRAVELPFLTQCTLSLPTVARGARVGVARWRCTRVCSGL